MICKQCGAQIADDAVECKFCGAVYEENIIPEEPETPEKEEAVSEDTLGEEKEDSVDEILDENEIKRRRQMERLRVEKQNQLDLIEKRRQDKKKKQKRNRILIILAAVIAAGGVGTGSYFLWKNHDNRPNIVISTQSPVDDSTALPTAAAVTPPVVSPTPAAATSEPEHNWQATNRGTSSNGSSTSTGSNSTSTGSSSGSSGSSSGSSSSGSGSSSSGSGSSSSSSGSSGSSSGSSSSSAVAAGTSSAGGETFPIYAPSYGGKEYTAQGGLNDGRFTSALITGIEVIESGGKNYMSFKYNNATYYAKVSPNTTTEFVKGRPMTIDAEKTTETYNGNVVYEINSIVNYGADYIFPNSGFELLTEADLVGKTPLQLLLGRNEIYARHGRKFQNTQIREYFESCDWYEVKPSYNYDDDSSNLNAIERENADFIKSYEERNN